jgi:hypothetical protein
MVKRSLAAASRTTHMSLMLPQSPDSNTPRRGLCPWPDRLALGAAGTFGPAHHRSRNVLVVKTTRPLVLATGEA